VSLQKHVQLIFRKKTTVLQFAFSLNFTLYVFTALSETESVLTMIAGCEESLLEWHKTYSLCRWRSVSLRVMFLSPFWTVCTTLLKVKLLPISKYQLLQFSSQKYTNKMKQQVSCNSCVY